ncbi:thioredoxin-like protein [Dothidotthia symphoricarpi CBS 119687]|uniref:Thioredoxin-like protein n=1 Tax=Dothidotthia symphoricarpi CBS 119687 TaxID=1392245 RepID=A0A6A6AHT6_9PLEO|nr:thioredoxin-like protein [Dothidotthia symphoricarpi CBS 119687]KAF2130434.1 thioredoxin-like protein [Dothidotthia symphoricarpi CBS 119687]
MANVNGNASKIKLYTNHSCPWAHRAHIVLKELGLEYDEVIIDLDKPREAWYLEINPRGLVPTIDIDGEIITESGIVAQFLADKYPSHLLPASTEGALARARINFFVDAWFSKAGSFWFQIMMKDTEEEKEKLGADFVSIVGKEIEPLLKNAEPFFGGSKKVTLAEALTAPFILRIYALAKHGFLPQSIISGFDALPNFSKWAAEVVKQESVTYIWDDATISRTQKKVESLRAQKAGSK